MKNILITGASSGIGRSLALHYASKGIHLILLARRKNLLNELTIEIKAKGATVELYEVDLSNFQKVQDIAAMLTVPDLIILNAGISLGHNSEFSSFKEFKVLMDVNFLSNHALIEPLIPKLVKGSKIVFISSLASYFTMPSSIAYSSSKRAINAYAQGLRFYLKPKGINVVNILPGFIDTQMTQKNNFSMPFFMDIESGTQRIVKAIESGKACNPFPKRFYIFIRLLSFLPHFLRDSIVSSLNKKKGIM